MKVHREFGQGSVEWSIARAGKLTASEFKNVVTSEFEFRTGEMLQTYLNKKIVERWTGGPLSEFNSWDMDQGSVLEEEALPWYNGIYNVELERVGLIERDDGLMACSPDGWCEKEQYGVEIKCPAVHTHVGYLRKGKLPLEYAPQVYGSMFVTGAEKWVFFSYCRGFPKLCLLVHRDPDVMSLIESAVERFTEMFNLGYDQIVDLNGGEPKHRQAAQKIFHTVKPTITSDVPTP